jgi:hypothetical protein
VSKRFVAAVVGLSLMGTVPVLAQAPFIGARSDVSSSVNQKSQAAKEIPEKQSPWLARRQQVQEGNPASTTPPAHDVKD